MQYTLQILKTVSVDLTWSFVKTRNGAPTCICFTHFPVASDAHGHKWFTIIVAVQSTNVYNRQGHSICTKHAIQ